VAGILICRGQHAVYGVTVLPMSVCHRVHLVEDLFAGPA
jgi:hypothetical protein